MIRPFTCITLLLAAGSGLYLYSAKHQAQLVDRDIARLVRAAQDNRARAAMLHAEYDLLGDPERLRELSSQVLTLQSTAPTQFTTFAELDRRLPPPGPLPQPPEKPVVPIAAVPVEKTPEKAPERPMPIASMPIASTPIASTPIALAAPPSRPTPKPAPVVASITPAAPRPATPPTALAPAPLPVQARPAVPAATPQPVPRRPQAESPPPATAADALARVARGGPGDATAPVVAAAPVVASALGMARAITPPPSVLGTFQAQPVSATLPQARR